MADKPSENTSPEPQSNQVEVPKQTDRTSGIDDRVPPQGQGTQEETQLSAAADTRDAIASEFAKATDSDRDTDADVDADASGQDDAKDARGSSWISEADRIDDAGDIARGHADRKHGAEFPGMSSADLERHVRDTMTNPGDVKDDLNGQRKAYLGQDGSTIVIHDPMHEDGGTVFNRPIRPDDTFWDDLE